MSVAFLDTLSAQSGKGREPEVMAPRQRTDDFARPEKTGYDDINWDPTM
jgi:hypothetical protein